MAHEDDTTGTETALDSRVVRALSTVDEVDFELVDPPPDLWTAIEMTVSSEEARRPPAQLTASPTTVEYWIDGADVVAAVGAGWTDFATVNDAPELSSLAADRTLWSYFDRDEVRELWQLVVARVRDVGAAARIQFRCDAPHARRWFVMTVTPETDGGVHFRSVLAFEEPRSPVALLDPHTERAQDHPAIPICSWCNRGQHGDRWLDVEELIEAGRLLERQAPPPVSYGVCGGCREQMAAELLVPASATNRSS